MKKCSLVMAITLAFILTGIVDATLDEERLLLYWPCDEGSGDTLVDASGNGWNGELTGGEWVPGQFGQAIHLERELAMVEGDVIGSTGQTGEITLACWFMLHTHSTYNGLISIEAPEGECCEYRLMVNPERRPFWNAGHHVDLFLAEFAFELETWYHYALVANGEVDKIYVNGEFIGEQPEDFPLPELGEVTVYLGTGESPGTWPIEDGEFDEVTIWDKALTEAEVGELMSGGFLAVQPQGKLASIWAGIRQAQ